MYNYSKLPKDVLAVIKPPLWNSYRYVSVLTRKAYESAIPGLLEPGRKYDVLDYGCGARPYEYLFENNLNKYTGIDVGSNPRADKLIGPQDPLPENDEQYDFVLSSQVLEHVENVDKYMDECRRVLRNDGHLLLSTHGTWQFHASPYDYNRWTHLGLKLLLKKHGFEVEKCIPILGQFALTSQLRLSFYDSFANMLGTFGRFLLAPISVVYQFKMMVEDLLTPQRVKDRDSAIFLLVGKKIAK
jgi:SAM-dependent methyltransferase